MYVCKESRECIQRLQTPRTWLVRDTDYRDYKRMDTRQYINLDTDTVWAIGRLPRMILNDAALDDDSIFHERPGRTTCNGKSRLNCLVLSSGRWKDPLITEEESDPGGAPILSQFGSPRHLFIELCSQNIISASKVKFIEPRWPPRHQGSVKPFREDLYETGALVKEDTTWQELALRVEHVLRQYKEAEMMSKEELSEGKFGTALVTWNKSNNIVRSWVRS